jgi:predicted metal-binding protein
MKNAVFWVVTPCNVAEAQHLPDCMASCPRRKYSSTNKIISNGRKCIRKVQVNINEEA